jgi:hypothetical protein
MKSIHSLKVPSFFFRKDTRAPLLLSIASKGLLQWFGVLACGREVLFRWLFERSNKYELLPKFNLGKINKLHYLINVDFGLKFYKDK